MAVGGLDFSNLPAFGTRKPDEEAQPARGWFRAGVSSGIDSTQAYLGSALQGVGKIVGLRTVEDIGRGIAERNMLEAQQNGRADLEVAPWAENGAPVLPWLGYQAAKHLPILATYLAGGKAYRSAGGSTPQALERAAASLPRAIGGGGLRAGADFATRRAALTVGREMAGDIVGGAAAGVPIAFGSMVNEADQKEGGATVQDVQKAALLSPVYSALDALQPAGIKGLLQKGLTGNIVRRVATASLAGAAAEVPQEAIQTAMELSFRPDLSNKDKFNQIVDAAVTGGAVGGVFGAFGGVRRMKSVDPTSVATEDLNSVADEFLGLPAPTAYVNSAGDAAIGADGLDRVRNAFRPGEDITALPGPGDVGPRSALDGSTMVVGRNREGGRFAPGMSAVEQPAVDDTARSFRNWTTPEVRSAINVLNDQREAGTLKPSYAQFIPALEQELAARNEALTNSELTDVPSRSGAAQAGLAAGGKSSESAAPAPATQSWDTERDTLLKGIATRKWYKEASTPEELDTILRARLEDGSTAKSDFELAKRRGIDVNAPSAPVEAAPAGAQDAAPQTSVDRVQTSETPAPAAPASQEGGDASVDLKFQKKWQRMLLGEGGGPIRGAAVTELRKNPPANEQEALVRVFNALAEPGAKDTKRISAPPAGRLDGIEEVARKMGIVNQEGLLTPKGEEVSRMALTFAEAAQAAIDQGFKGSAAAAFERGARAQPGDPEPKLRSQEAKKAYAAGKQWVVPKGISNPILTPAERGEIPAAAKTTQTMNLAIDGTQQSLGAREDDVVAMKRMVREGNIEGAMEALNRVQRGESLFEQPAPAPVDFKGEVVTRGAPRAGRVGSVTLVDTKATTRAQAERAIRKYELQRQIDAAFEEGAIDSKRRLSLINKLRQGKFAEVRAAVPDVPVELPRSTQIRQKIAERKAQLADFKAALEEALAQAQQDSEVSELQVDERGVLRNEQVKVARRDFLAALAATAAVGIPTQGRSALKFTPLKAELKTIMSAEGPINPVRVLEHLKQHSSDSSYRLIANKLLRGDWSKVSIIVSGDSYETRGTTQLNDDGSTTVEINGEDGLNEQTLLHELIHAYVQQRWAGLSVYTPNNKQLLKDSKDRGDAMIDRFTLIWSNIGEVLKAKGLIDEQIWARASYSDPDEMLSWVLTNPDAQAYLRSIDEEGNPIVKPKPKSQMSIWDKIVQFFAELFGSNNTKTRSALDQILSAGYAVLDAGANVPTGDFNLKMAQRIAQRRSMPMAKGIPTSPRALNERMQDVSAALSKQFDETINKQTIKGKLLRFFVGAMQMTHMVEQYKDIFPQQQLVLKAHSDRKATTAILGHLYDAANALRERLQTTKEGRKVVEATYNLMTATAWDIDPAKPWDKHTHLANNDNVENLKARHAEYHRQYNSMVGTKQLELYNTYAQLNQMEHYASMALAIRHLANGDAELMNAIPALESDPMAAFRQDSTKHTAVEARKYWRDVLQTYVSQVDDYIVALRGVASNIKSTRMSPIESYIGEVKQGLAAMDRAPYFHLGRFGDQFVSGSIRVGKDKKVDPVAMEHVARELEKAGVTGVMVSWDLSQPTVYLRMDSISQRQEVARLFIKLQKQGWLNGEIPIKAGPREQGEWLPERTRAEMNRFIQAFRSDPMFDPTEDMSEDQRKSLDAMKQRAVSVAYDVWLDMLPDAAMSKVLTHRESKPGFSTDMGRAFAFRYNIGVNSLSSLSAEPHITNAFEQMRARLQEAKTVENELDVDTITTLYAEHARREGQRALNEGQDVFDTWRAWTHAFYLGFSPSYMAVNLTQIGVLLWPELAKKHGYVKAAKVIAKATPKAFAVLKAAWVYGGGVKGFGDVTLAHDVLTDIFGANTSEMKYMSAIVGSGTIDIGNAARQLAQISEGRDDSAQGRALKYAAAAGLYSETFTRLVAALASHDLNGADVDTGVKIIRESMLEYSTWNQARAMGKMGLAGPMTPVMTSFMSYSVQVMWKLYRELYDGFIRTASTAEQKKVQAEARKFLAGHLMAVTTLAGTLGMPFATVAAAAAEKLVDLFGDDDEPFDATAAWRNYMAEIFGKEIGEIASRGVPRALGIDLSQRAGEQSLLPGTQWLVDKRKWKDAATEASLRSLGAPVSMLSSIGEGFEKIGDGDLTGGLITMMPISIKGPTQAYRMTDEGYVDTLGNKLPMTPGATAILSQVLGFTPAEKAEYSEARGDQAALKSVLEREAGILRKGIAEAYLSGDIETARELIREAQKFDRANPKYAVLPDIEAAIERRMRQQALAAATDTPIGVVPDDINARELTSYANIEFQPQR